LEREGRVSLLGKKKKSIKTEKGNPPPSPNKPYLPTRNKATRPMAEKKQKKGVSEVLGIG